MTTQPDDLTISPRTGKPISPRRLAANMANAQRSTGPRTTDGKSRTRLNAQKTGLTGSLLPIRAGAFREDPLEIERLLDEILDSLEPRDELERQVAVQIATTIQRIKRGNRVEAVNFAGFLRLTDDVLDTEEIHDAQYNAHLYRAAASLLDRDSSTLSPKEAWDLVLAQSYFDPAIEALAASLAASEVPDLSDALDAVLASIANVHGTGAETQARYRDLAETEAAKVPDEQQERIIAEKVVRDSLKDGTIEAVSRILTRLSLDLDRNLARYEKLRKRPLDEPPTPDPGPAIGEVEDDDDDDLEFADRYEPDRGDGIDDDPTPPRSTITNPDGSP